MLTLEKLPKTLPFNYYSDALKDAYNASKSFNQKMFTADPKKSSIKLSKIAWLMSSEKYGF